MRSHSELLEASGYGSRPNEFDDLLRILDGELRLITPTDPEGIDSEEGQRPEGRYYHLTHDYLVPSIRDWLTRKQKETRRGRAELLLTDRSSLWNAKPENRLLPSISEWVSIWLLTKKRDWNEPERRMMDRAGRVHGLRVMCAAALAAVLIVLGLIIHEQVTESNRETIATGLVEQVLTADIAKVPNIVGLMSDYRRWADPALTLALVEATKGTSEELHARLALLPVDVSQVPFLEERLLVASARELAVLRDALKPHRATLIPKLWSVLNAAQPGDKSLLPAASALADYDATGSGWKAAGDKVAQALVSVNPVFFGPWLDALRPVGTSLSSSKIAMTVGYIASSYSTSLSV